MTIDLDQIDQFDATKASGQSIDELPEQARQRVREAKERVEQLRDDPSDFIESRRNYFDRGVEQTTDREPTDPDNITMHQHMKNQRDAIDDNPDPFVDREIERTNRRAERAVERAEEGDL